MFNIEKKSKFWKIEKPTWRYYHFIHLHHKWQSYDVWFLRNRVRQTEFFIILDCFCPFTHLWSQKIKILNQKKKKKKTPEDIIILYMCTINDNHLMHGSWDMECNRQNLMLFWAFFCPFTPVTTKKVKIL